MRGVHGAFGGLCVPGGGLWGNSGIGAILGGFRGRGESRGRLEALGGTERLGGVVRWDSGTEGDLGRVRLSGVIWRAVRGLRSDGGGVI